MKNISQTGRTLTEMLGTLAIMGVLSITAIAGYQFAMNKLKANRIYNDIKLAYVSIHTSQNVPYQWSKNEYKSDYGYDVSVRRDKTNNDFVMVGDVAEGVCDRLLDLAKDGQEMTLYDVNSDPLVCSDTQNIVASFSGEPPLIPCENGVGDCPEGYNSYCDATEQVCLKCDLGQRTNDDGTGCVDLCADRADDYTVSCMSEQEGINWCCPADSLCSEDEIGKCISDENACIYELEMSDYRADCSGTLSISGYKADCSGTLTITTNADGTQTASMSSSGCKDGEYCIFAWSTGEWGLDDATPTLTASHTGEFFGQCHSLLSTSGATAAAIATVTSSGCKNGEYCIFAWSDETWPYGATAPTLTAEYTGKMWGQCHSLLSTSGATAAASASLKPIKECDDDKYCDIRWPVSDCKSTLKAEHTGRFYGACAEWDKTNASCPVSETGVTIE